MDFIYLIMDILADLPDPREFENFSHIQKIDFLLTPPQVFIFSLDEISSLKSWQKDPPSESEIIYNLCESNLKRKFEKISKLELSQWIDLKSKWIDLKKKYYNI